MGSIPVGSTKKQTQTCLLLLSLRRIERLLTQPDSRALDKLADEREYKKADTDVPAFAIPTWNRRTAFRRPDSRTLGRLADTREYQNDCEDSRFYMMKRKGWRFRTHKKDFDSRCFFFAFHNFAPECFLISQSKHARQEQYEPWSRRRIFDKYCVTLAA